MLKLINELQWRYLVFSRFIVLILIILLIQCLNMEHEWGQIIISVILILIIFQIQCLNMEHELEMAIIMCEDKKIDITQRPNQIFLYGEKKIKKSCF